MHSMAALPTPPVAHWMTRSLAGPLIGDLPNARYVDMAGTVNDGGGRRAAGAPAAGEGARALRDAGLKTTTDLL
ncbi:hypothetical protein NJB1728e18_36760 [Mycobacterium marinum]|nr:hypothetical protein NJB1907E8_46410 [Mycobacterium marinum]GJO12625.1 hypothetical protein NJB1907E90_34950 [Mycobacterium marinum]GJO20703.1 hypothetical protein NJB1907f22_00680 [Mycobacterium marinum]GJO27014.1 hypothetical protein NJB1728e18_36760 [Mycobacterium marinum]GJO28778.1 hypothetical protein NJB1907E11_47410 [Mycobacterium marinum]